MEDNEKRMPNEGTPLEEALREATPQAETGQGAAAELAPEREIEDLRNRLLRTQAELENFRKRSARELMEQRKYAAAGLLTDLLPVIDDVQRAIEAAEKAGESPQLLEGFKITKNTLLEVLQRHDCRFIAAQGEPFDPHLHDAILMQPSAEAAPGTVLHVAREGYTLHDRVIRPAQVIVASEP